MLNFKFSAGLISGLLLGFLFAPDKGEVIRKKLKDSAESLHNRWDRLFGNHKDEWHELKSILENESEEISRDTRQRLLQLLQDNENMHIVAQQ